MSEETKTETNEENSGEEGLLNIQVMDKDQLAAYALKNFDVILNKRAKLESLRTQVEKLQKGETLVDEVSETEEVAVPKYLRHPVNKRVFNYTKNLAKRGDMIPCDADGNNI